MNKFDYFDCIVDTYIVDLEIALFRAVSKKSKAILSSKLSAVKFLKNINDCNRNLDINGFNDFSDDICEFSFRKEIL